MKVVLVVSVFVAVVAIRYMVRPGGDDLAKGKAFLERGDYDSAVDRFNEVIRLRPYFAKAYKYRGEAYYKNGDYDNAIADYSQAIQLNPDDAEAYKNRGSAYQDKANSDWRRADELVEAGLRRSQFDEAADADFKRAMFGK